MCKSPVKTPQIDPCVLSGKSGLHIQKETKAFDYTSLSVNLLVVNAILISDFDGRNVPCSADLSKKVLYIYKLP